MSRASYTFLGDLAAATWMDDAACTGGDPDEWFPTAESRTDHLAKSVCGVCPVRLDCLRWALTHDEKGVWGGLNDKERARLRKGAAA